MFCLVVFCFIFYGFVGNLAHDAIRFSFVNESYFNKIMHFLCSKYVLFPFCISMQMNTYTNTPYAFRNFESESFTNS